MLAWLGLVALAGLLAWSVPKLRVYFAAGAGYAAKVLCTGVFGSGRALDEALTEQVRADRYWILRPFRADVAPVRRTVTTSFFGLLPRTAVHRDGFGATLVSGALAPVPDATAWSWRHAPPVAWRATDSPALLRRIVDQAFTEPNPRRRRRTFAVLVVRDGEIVAEQYAPGFGPETPLPGWSMAKAVTNALVGLLVDEGRLRLDQRELVPAWRAPDPRASITLEDLLRMRSGLRFSEVYANPWSDVVHMLYECRDMAAYAASRPLAAPPGVVWSYSSGTTNILSAIIRQALGDAAYHPFPGRALFGPLGMRSAVLEADSAGTFVGSSYMLATARDWARFGQLFLDGGRSDGRQLLPTEWVRFSTTPTPQSPGGRYGAHWWLKLNPEIGGDTEAARRIAPDAFFAIGHEGQTLSIIPSKRLVVVRLGAAIYIDAWNQAEFIRAVQDAL